MTENDVVQVIQILGGLDNVINHCLNDNNCCQQNIDNNHIEILKQKLLTKKEFENNQNKPISNKEQTEQTNENKKNTTVSKSLQQPKSNTLEMDIS